MNIRKNDMVVVQSGADSSTTKTAKVLQVIPQTGRAIVEGMRVRKKHMRKSQDNPQGAIVDRETPIDLSNLMLYCPTCKKGVRIKSERSDGKRTRKCRRCEHSFDG